MLPTSRARPTRSATAVEDAVRRAVERRAPLRIHGAGNWLDAGWPVANATPLSLASESGITEYNPGDLTLTARAGTSLDEIERVTAAERQWLALDPFGPSTSTLGATIATASYGPLSHAFGTPRDNVLGLEAVTGDGQTVRTGGRVVKNVAGFDLTRLFTGAWGTLAVITEATVRLRALPEVEESWAIAVDETTESLDALFARLRFAPLEALALELVSPSLASRLGVESRGRAALLVRLGGNEGSVRAQREYLRTFTGPFVAPRDVWRSLRECEPARAATARFSAPPSRMAKTWAAVRAAAGDSVDALAHASIGRGVARCITPIESNESGERLVAAAARFDGTVIFERLPTELWPRTRAENSTGESGTERLARGMRSSFDPMRVLNPGILGERTDEQR
jgi:glycolate oxidase FAD binding subunit